MPRGMQKLSPEEKVYVGQCKALALELSDEIPGLGWGTVRRFIDTLPSAPKTPSEMVTFRARQYYNDQDFVDQLRSFALRSPATKVGDETRRNEIKEYMASHFAELVAGFSGDFGSLGEDGQGLTEVGKVLYNAFLLGKKDRPRRGVSAAMDPETGQWYYTKFHPETNELDWDITPMGAKIPVADHDLDLQREDAKEDLRSYLESHVGAKQPMKQSALPLAPAATVTVRPKKAAAGGRRK